MPVEWIPVVQTALLVACAVFVAYLGARMLRRDSRQAGELPAMVGRLDALRTALDALREALAEQRSSDLAATRARLDAIQDAVAGATETAATARRIASRREAKPTRAAARIDPPDLEGRPPAFVTGAAAPVDPPNGRAPTFPSMPIGVDESEPA